MTYNELYQAVLNGRPAAMTWDSCPRGCAAVSVTAETVVILMPL